jgi:hypothetical protein
LKMSALTLPYFGNPLASTILAGSAFAIGSYPRTVTKVKGITLLGTTKVLPFKSTYYYPGLVKEKSKREKVSLGEQWKSVPYSTSYLGCSYEDSAQGVDYKIYATEARVRTFVDSLKAGGFFEGNNNDLRFAYREGSSKKNQYYFYPETLSVRIPEEFKRIDKKFIGKDGKLKRVFKTADQAYQDYKKRIKRNNLINATNYANSAPGSSKYLLVRGKWLFSENGKGKKQYYYATLVEQPRLKMTCAINLFMHLKQNKKAIAADFFEKIGYYVQNSKLTSAKTPVAHYRIVKVDYTLQALNTGKPIIFHIVHLVDNPVNPVGGGAAAKTDLSDIYAHIRDPLESSAAVINAKSRAAGSATKVANLNIRRRIVGAPSASSSAAEAAELAAMSSLEKEIRVACPCSTKCTPKPDKEDSWCFVARTSRGIPKSCEERYRSSAVSKDFKVYKYRRVTLGWARRCRPGFERGEGQ